MENKADRLRSFLNQVAPGDNVESVLESNTADFTSSAAAADPRAATALKHVVQGRELSGEDEFALEAIVLPDWRPAIDIVNGDFTIADPTWQHLDTNVRLHQAIRSTLASIGRIDPPDPPALAYFGTGFVVGDGLIMTNRHVAQLFTSGLGTNNLRFLPDISPGIDFMHERGSDASMLLEIDSVAMIHPYWDMALLNVDGLPDQHPVLKLSLDDPDDLVDLDIVCIGYPAFDARNDARVQDKVFGGVYNVKRLQPGKIRGRRSTTSFGKKVTVGTHDSSTLGGNSGSAVIDPHTGHVMALHFAGIYLKENYAVPMCDLAYDQRVVDCGLAFAATPSPRGGAWDEWWHKATAEATAATPAGAVPPRTLPIAGNGHGVVTDAEPAAPAELVIRCNIPLEITVRLTGDAVVVTAVNTAAPVISPEAEVDQTEKIVAPYHDPNYANRKGYDSGFLTGFDVPLPRTTKPSQLAALADGNHVIPYHHFSIVMDKHRRLPVFTASNLDYSPAAKKPEPGDYTRKGLSGLGPNDLESWFVDPRLPTICQLSDRFFTKDAGAFDRGHVVRRKDVAWGSSYQEVRDAVGDTFHITNCTPQVAGFNRPANDTNWGDLEVFVAKQAESGRLSLFAGPVLAPDDPIFSGVTDGGVLRAQIPRRYWKVVTAAQSGQLASFGFILDQNLDDVPLEFAVSPEWTAHMIAVKDLERLLGHLKFPAEVKKADQAGTVLGQTLRGSAGIDLVSDDRPAAGASQ